MVLSRHAAKDFPPAMLLRAGNNLFISTKTKRGLVPRFFWWVSGSNSRPEGECGHHRVPADSMVPHERKAHAGADRESPTNRCSARNTFAGGKQPLHLHQRKTGPRALFFFGCILRAMEDLPTRFWEWSCACLCLMFGSADRMNPSMHRMASGATPSGT